MVTVRTEPVTLEVVVVLVVLPGTRVAHLTYPSSEVTKERMCVGIGASVNKEIFRRAIWAHISDRQTNGHIMNDWAYLQSKAMNKRAGWRLFGKHFNYRGGALQKKKVRP